MSRPRKDTFEMATGQGYREMKAYIVGSFAIHNDVEPDYWKISHRATGFYTVLWGRTLTQAVEIAERLDAAADWKKVRRRPVLIGSAPEYRGVTKAMSTAVKAVRRDYRHLARAF